jgi:hypothetical protein
MVEILPPGNVKSVTNSIFKLFAYYIIIVLQWSTREHSSCNLAMAANSGKLKMRQNSTNGEKFAEKCAE